MADSKATKCIKCGSTFLQQSRPFPFVHCVDCRAIGINLHPKPVAPDDETQTIDLELDMYRKGEGKCGYALPQPSGAGIEDGGKEEAERRARRLRREWPVCEWGGTVNLHWLGDMLVYSCDKCSP